MNYTKIAVDIFEKRAEDYQQKFMDVSLYHESFDIFCDHIKNKNGTVLELACGPGNITKYLLAKRPDLQIFATDIAPAMLELAKANNPTATFKIMDSREIVQLHQKFDAIMCGFGLPYLSKEDALKLIADAASALNPEGIFYISTMEDDNDKSAFTFSSKGDKMFTNYHEAGYLTITLEQNNFSVINLQRKIYFGPDGKETTDLIIIAKRN